MSDQKPPRVETIFDDPALALKAAKQGDMEGEPTLRPAVYENNPRLVVKTKVPNDRNNGKIEAATNTRAFYAVLRAIEELANSGPEPDQILMDNKGHRFVDKKRDPNPSIMSCTEVKKDENGVISITISAGKNRPLIPFYFLDDTYHQFRGRDGQPMDVRRASKLYALAWVDEMRFLMSMVIKDGYVKPAWMTRFENNNNQQGNQQRNNYGGGGGGGYQGGGSYGGGQQNRNNGGGNNYGGGQQQAPQVQGGGDFDFSDDVPM